MKLQNLSLISILFICLTKGQDIILSTNYTLSYLQKVDMNQMKCTSDKDCPLYSTCESFTSKNNETRSLCKFGDFLCPERDVSFFMTENVDENCFYVNTTMYDLENEEIKEGFPKNIKPVLKTCGYFGETYKCSTEECNSNSDCLSGMCKDYKCMNKDNLNNYIYRCSVDDYEKYSMKCKKANGMKCEENIECYSGICSCGDDRSIKYHRIKYCSNKDYKFNSIGGGENVNADNTVGQPSRANADSISDPSGIG
ncbi:hypothetical protein BCR32DRAFT_296634 [Anaeromyces robustus]|uniref:Dickkopf N-terminal cysteine-rich domain-containing protein n=1 Tax=Anaeromyces robustus TaxID=1754192 RepID=A0A1Y1WRU6_9FUNG|nr:hypothetical protein BCR32DRAFT_296634 [Anaeromyces robustus]|eukprot:ORX75844.1 hypothetical protein BCR32DRAFT_296634 [Anaeromyces robustus]